MTTTCGRIHSRLTTRTIPLKEAMQMSSFNYGEVVSLKLSFADRPTSRDFYCIDQETVDFIRLLANHCLFPDWEKHPDCWEKKEPHELLVVKSPRGWLAIRRYWSAATWNDTLEKTLTHLEHAMPILFPDPETAVAAAELCYPKPHPALYWTGKEPKCMMARVCDKDYALGRIGWERSLRDGVQAEFFTSCPVH